MANQHEKSLQVFFDNQIVGMIEVDVQGRYVNVNQCWLGMIGYSYEEIVSTDFQSLTHPDDLPRQIMLDNELRHRIRSSYQMEKRYLCKNGNILWTDLSVSGIYDQGGTLTGMTGLVIDISERKQSEIELEQERRLFSQGPVLSIIWDPAEGWPIRYVSSNALTILGYSVDEMKASGFKYVSLIHPEDVTKVSTEVTQHISRQDKAFEQSYRLKKKSGEYCWFYDATRFEWNERGQLSSIRGYILDQTPLKKSEQELCQNRQRLEYILAGTDVGTWEWDISTGTTAFNERWATIIGYSLKDLLPTTIDTWTKFVHPEDIKKSELLLSKHFSGESDLYQCEVRMKHKQGHWVWVLDSGKVAAWSDDGKPLTMYGTHQDITQRKIAEETLSRTEELQRTLLDASPDIICFKDGEGRWLLANTSDLRLFQLEGINYQGKTDAELAPFSPFYSSAFLNCEKTDNLAWAAGGISIVEEEIPTPDRGTRTYEVIKHPLFHPDGRRKALVVIGRDITERKKYEEGLKESEKKFRTLLDHMERIPIQGYDEERKVVYWNPASTEVYGYTREEALGQKLESLIIPAQMRAEVVETIEHWLKKENSSIPAGELILCDREGNDVPVYSSHIMYTAASGKKELFCIDIDLRMLHKAESELRRLAAAVEQTGETIVITDAEANIVYVNQAFTAVTGYSSEEALGQNPRILQSGEVDEALYVDLWETLLKGETWKGRFVNKKKDGSLFTEDVNISPIVNSAGKVVNYVAAKRDVTEQLLTEEQYRQSQKLEAIGQMAGGVAHDFNNMMAIILGQVEIAMMKLPASDPLLKRLLEIKTAAQRSSELTQQLLGFARRQPNHPQLLNMNHSIAKTITMLERLIGENINLNWSPKAEYPLVKIDPSHLDQILTNLVVNARDAIKGSGIISVATSQVVMDEEFCQFNPGSHPGDYVLLRVSDNGCGMSRELLGKIFDPFFTTKDVGKGTGLGLSMVFGLVKQNNGYMTVDSALGKGSVFNLFLPCVAGREEALITPRNEAFIPGTETILVVEDEASLLDITTSMLSEAGYTVLSAQEPFLAIQLAEKYSGTINLLLTDVVMPKMSGIELSACLTRSRPELKTLYMSGYPREVHGQSGQQNLTGQLLVKPFSIYRLTRDVRATLDQQKISVPDDFYK